MVKSGKRMPFDAPLVALQTRHQDGKVVEAVDLKPVVNDGQIPVEQVDEQPLAVLEHGFEQRLIGRRAEPFNDMDH